VIRDLNDPSGTGVARFSKPTPSVYRGTVQRIIGSGLWEFFGHWYSLKRPISQKAALKPNAVFHPIIRPEYQGRLVGVDVVVSRIESPAGRSDLTLKMELKGWTTNGNEIVSHVATISGRTALITSSFPRTFSFTIPPNIEPFGVLTVILDRAVPGDSLEIDDVFVRLEDAAGSSNH
jgi:hypothetical protein